MYGNLKFGIHLPPAPNHVRVKCCDQEAVTGEKVECREGQERPSAPDFVHHGARYEKAEEGPETQKCDCIEKICKG